MTPEQKKLVEIVAITFLMVAIVIIALIFI